MLLSNLMQKLNIYLKPFTISHHVQQTAWIRLWRKIFVEKFVTTDMNLNLGHRLTGESLC